MLSRPFIRGRGTRTIARVLLACSLVLAPAAGIAFLPQAAMAQDVQDFRVALEGYGQWTIHQRWGDVWIPDNMPADWQPYRLGQWAYTEEWGWYWDSEEDFGWITYHYGRWIFDRGMGWIWVPRNEWAPAWVDWRQGDDFVGWAPLPPDEVIDEDYETPDTFLYVRAGDLLTPRVYRACLPARDRFTHYNRSFLVNRSVMLRSNARLGVNPGVPPAFIARASGRPFRAVSVAPVVLGATAGVAGAIVLRENFRDRERTRVQLRETARSIQPNEGFSSLKPLQKGERGQLGTTVPMAARGSGIIDTRSKNFGGGKQNIQIQNQGVQQKVIVPQGGQKNIGSQNNQIKTQDDVERKDWQKKDLQKKDWKKDDEKKEERKKDWQQKNLQQQNLQQKNFQQQNGGGQNNQQQFKQQNVQPRIQQQQQNNTQPRIQQQNIQQQNIQQQNNNNQQRGQQKTFDKKKQPDQ